MSSPLQKHEGHSGRLSGDDSAQVRRPGGAFEGSCPQVFFAATHILLCSEKIVLKVLKAIW